MVGSYPARPIVVGESIRHTKLVGNCKLRRMLTNYRIVQDQWQTNGP
jgi:Flp pilus assembly protein CpaB